MTNTDKAVKTKVFFLGGADLEMETIKSLLKDNGYLFVDKELDWSNAKLSAYREEFEKYPSEEYEVYAVELQEDIDLSSRPEGYYNRIDHHNELQDEPSSLEQVAKLIGHKLTGYEKLVAANDKGYYPAMKKVLDSASECERIDLIIRYYHTKEAKDSELSEPEKQNLMNEIRKEDRKSQGVTDEEERIAESIYKNKSYEFVGGLIKVLVDDDITHYSSICDRFYPYEAIVIYCTKDSRLCYYGKNAQKVYAGISSNFLSSDSHTYTYSGGGPDGYWGIEKNYVPAQDIEIIIGAIEKMVDSPFKNITSSHIFYFPFVWRDDSGNERDLKGLLSDFNKSKKKTWINATDADVESDHLYNELNYFFPFVHKEQYQYSDSLRNLISDTCSGLDNKVEKRSRWEAEPRVLHFERGEKGLKYEIVVRVGDYARRKYVLDIFGINLNLYSTGVGLLSFFTRNASKMCEEYDIRNGVTVEKPLEEIDILRINQYGRRLMPPFYKDVLTRTEMAESIAIKGLTNNEGGLYDDFLEYYSNPKAWKYSKIISALLEDFNENLYENNSSVFCFRPRKVNKSLQYQMVIDDRMFVLSWYKNNECIASAREEIAQCFEDLTYYRNYQNLQDYWYRFLFVDGGKDATCQDVHMKKQLLLDHTYTRWSGWNSLYGVTRYSMVYLTDEYVPDYLLKYFETIYARMAELVLMQRATVLTFSERVNMISNYDNNKKADREHAQKEVNKLCKDYIVFKNQFYFKEVTAQDQGIEMYDMLQKSLRLEEMVKDLDEDIQELYQYHSILEEQEGNRKAQKLNDIMSFFTPASCMAAVLAVGGWHDRWCSNCDSWSGFGLMALASLITIIVLKFWDLLTRKS